MCVWACLYRFVAFCICLYVFSIVTAILSFPTSLLPNPSLFVSLKAVAKPIGGGSPIVYKCRNISVEKVVQQLLHFLLTEEQVLQITVGPGKICGIRKERKALLCLPQHYFIVRMLWRYIILGLVMLIRQGISRPLVADIRVDKLVWIEPSLRNVLLVAMNLGQQQTDISIMAKTCRIAGGVNAVSKHCSTTMTVDIVLFSFR